MRVAEFAVWNSEFQKSKTDFLKNLKLHFYKMLNYLQTMSRFLHRFRKKLEKVKNDSNPVVPK